MSASTWLPDPSHYPEQLTPLSASVWFEAIGYGIHESMRELRGPFGGFEARTELGWAYEGELEPDWEPKEGALREAALELPERWERELRPRAHEITAALHALRPERVSGEDVVAVFDRMWTLVLDQWVVHFLAVIPAQTSIEMAFEAFVEDHGDEDPLAPYRLLQGPNETTEADDMLRRLAGLAKDLDVADVVATYPVETALEQLRELRGGRTWIRELDAYLDRFGGRARLHELSLPREVERPEMTLESVRLFLEAGDAEPPRNAAPPEAPDVSARLGEILPAARFGYGLKESHVYHIDYPGLLATREVLLGFGRRLLAEGVLESLDDLWMLWRPELRDALVGDAPDLVAIAEAPRGDRRQGIRAPRGRGGRRRHQAAAGRGDRSRGRRHGDRRRPRAGVGQAILSATRSPSRIGSSVDTYRSSIATARLCRSIACAHPSWRPSCPVTAFEPPAWITLSQT